MHGALEVEVVEELVGRVLVREAVKKIEGTEAVSTLSGTAMPDGIGVEYFMLGSAGAPVSILASADPGLVAAVAIAANAPDWRSSRFVNMGTLRS